MTERPTDRTVILIIDEDPLTLTGMAAVLDMAGFECHCARGREAAFKAARSLPIDLILCDMQLRDESGEELISDLLLEPGMSEVPVMFLTATQAADIALRSLAWGSAYFVRKPFEPEIVIDLIGKSLWKSHQTRQRVASYQNQSACVIPSPKLNSIASAIQDIKIPQA